AGSTGEARGAVGGASSTAAFNFTSDSGQDCVTTPVTGVTVLAPTFNVGTGSSEDARQAHHSFGGTCSVQGDVTFDPPLTVAQTRSDVVYDATGHCTGTLDGRNVTEESVALH